MKSKILYTVILLSLLTGCGSMKNMSREHRAGIGAQIGSFVGWIFGGAVGHAIGDDIGGDIGAFVGTAVGGVAGAQIAANTGERVKVEKRMEKLQTASYRALLPDLQIEEIFLEEDSATCDYMINAGETCRITLVIVNNSFQEALDVEPIVKVDKGRHLELSEPVKIARITHDDRITYSVMVQASQKLRTGEAVFSVRLKEGYGSGTDKETFTVKTLGADKSDD